MVEFNSINIKRLENIPNDLRYEIIFFDTLIGSLNAHKDYEKETQRDERDFYIKRITTQIYESEKISSQRENTLKLLEKESPEKVVKYLKRISSELEKREYSGVFKELIPYLESEIMIKKIGNRLEKRLDKIYFYDNERDKKRIFLEEESEIIHSILYEKGKS